MKRLRLFGLNIRIVLSFAIALGALSLLWQVPGSSQAPRAVAQGPDATISSPVTPVAVAVDPNSLRVTDRGPIRTLPEGEPLPTQAPPAGGPIPDLAAQVHEEGPFGPMELPSTLELTDPIVNVPGITANAAPPDTVGDVGPNHYVQMTNAPATGGQTAFQIFNKDGTPAPLQVAGSPIGPFRFGGLWPVGDLCRSDLGDPIVVYDHLADRWLLSQFFRSGAVVGMCIAISQTPDPTANSWGAKGDVAVTSPATKAPTARVRPARSASRAEPITTSSASRLKRSREG